jgi:FKBP-type peptidyl-prolyl cis-trans isomerase
MSTKLNLREQRRAARAKRRNQQRLIVIISIVIIVGAIAGLIYYKISQDNRTAGEVVTTASGLQYQDLEVGTGQEAKNGDTVSVHYEGFLEDDTKFDSSRDRGEPLVVTIGAGGVIPGWEEGLVGMREGGIRKLIIPPDLAYGAQGIPGVIPEDATLTFEIELLDVQ